MTRNGHLTHAVVIAGSILVALGLEQAVGYATDRIKESAYQRDLVSEIRESRGEFDRDQTRRNEMKVLLETMLLRERTPAWPADSIEAALRALTDYRFFTPAHTVMDDLIQSGNFRILRSSPLRISMFDYVQESQRLQTAEQRDREFIQDHLEPFLNDQLDTNDLLDGDISTSDRRAFEELLIDTKFRNLLRSRLSRLNTTLRFAEHVERTLSEIETNLTQ